jgi:hypothetical protein
MATYEDQSFRRNRIALKFKYLKLEDDTLVLLREALHVATVASEATKIGDPKKVWKATYEAVIASAPEDIRNMANILRNYYGIKSKH